VCPLNVVRSAAPNVGVNGYRHQATCWQRCDRRHARCTAPSRRMCCAAAPVAARCTPR
jgi:hypothetical protein